MRKICLTFFSFLLLCSCGERIRDAADTTESLLVGTWDSVSNTKSVCHERIRFNSDKTFWWFQDNFISYGTYGRESNQLNFKFTNQAWEMVKFQVTDRDLYLERRGETTVYSKVPTSMSTKTTSLCPSDKIEHQEEQ